MTRFIDARVPVAFGSAGDDAEAALLLEGDAAPPPGRPAERFTLPAGAAGHAIGCACCTPRGPAAEALGALFLARARGSVGFFRRVIAVTSPAGEAAVRAAIGSDPLVSARFRLAQPGLDQPGSEASPGPSGRCM
jgi:hypothetical protein